MSAKAGEAPASHNPIGYLTRAALERFRERRTRAPLPGSAEDIALYNVRSPAGDDMVTDRVWDDLDMSAVFAQVDACASAPGQQLLHYMLRRPVRDAVLLAHLNDGCHVAIVSTHDHELIHLLPSGSGSGAQWEFHHFSETVSETGASFDFVLRPGVSSAPNALRLLAANGYPQDVVADAFRTYEELGRGGQFPGVDSNHH